jgi:hypothetical protein
MGRSDSSLGPDHLPEQSGFQKEMFESRLIGIGLDPGHPLIEPGVEAAMEGVIQ